MRVWLREIPDKFTNRTLLIVGLCIVLLSQIPYLLLGHGAVIPYHDQLDGELIAYIYQAKYLFSGQKIIPEFLCGASKTALCPPAPLAVVLFKIFPPLAAYLVMQVAGQITSFAGMFCLVNKMLAYGKADSERTDDAVVRTGIAGAKWIAFIVGIFYTFTPFLPVYGLSQYGMPLLLLCIWLLYEGKKTKTSLLYVAVYGGMSSLVLCGFAWLVLWAVALFVLSMRRKLGEHKVFFGGFTVLFAVYVVENFALLAQMIGIGESSISHKSEYVLTGSGFLRTFWNYFRYNAEHSADNHLWIAAMTLLLLIIILIYVKKCDAQTLVLAKCAGMNLGFLCVLYLAAALWDSSLGIAVRVHMGALGAFQFGRVLWLTPMLWQIELALCLAVLWNAKAWRRWMGYGVSAVLLCVAAFVILKNSLVKPCLQQLLKPNYDEISYEDYLAIGIMDQVAVFLEEEEGLQKGDYRVASLGIDPAAALYHGFYSVDGYSNNYDLEYKHAFRRVIAPELEKSEYLQNYYDDWGNRCYLFSAECPGYYTVKKNGFFYSDLSIDTEALKALGCDYILSAARVADAEEKSLMLMNEEGFETTGSYYRIFVYKIMPK